MDLFECRGYFDAQIFDGYNFASSAWVLNAVKGQLDLANPKVSLMNKGTRRRMMYVSPGYEPAYTVLRVGPTGQIFLAGQQSKDTLNSKYIRDVISLHEPQGVAIITRRLPAGPSNNPGWAIPVVLETTFGDYEIRSDNEDQNSQITQHGSWELTLPSNSAIQEHDTVAILGRVFYVFETFNESGLRGAHATDRSDDRYNFVYQALTGEAYDPAQLKNVKTFINYNVTGELTPYEEIQGSDSVITTSKMKLMILKAWIGIIPNLNDQIIYASHQS